MPIETFAFNHEFVFFVVAVGASLGSVVKNALRGKDERAARAKGFREGLGRKACAKAWALTSKFPPQFIDHLRSELNDELLWTFFEVHGGQAR